MVAGTMLSGYVTCGKTLLLGPDKAGLFKPVAIKSIHHKRVEVEEARCG